MRGKGGFLCRGLLPSRAEGGRPKFGCPESCKSTGRAVRCPVGIVSRSAAMSNVRTVREVNEELARQINEEALKSPLSPYANKWVGIANGKVVVVADSLDEMDRRLRE